MRWPPGTADIVHSQMCSDISSQLGANSNPTFVDVHKACMCIHQILMHKNRRAQRYCEPEEEMSVWAGVYGKEII